MSYTATVDLSTEKYDFYTYSVSKLIQNKAAIRGSVPDVQKALSSGANINNYAILVKFINQSFTIISRLQEHCAIKLRYNNFATLRHREHP